jgi:thiol-disulfide isomerase/thioredoxin
MSKQVCFALSLLALLGASSAAADDLRPFVRGSWQQIRDAHADKPAIVHVWGLTCAPCRAEMPNWGKLLAERPHLDLILIHADLVPNEPRGVKAALNASGLAAAENWIFQDSFVERLRFEIDPLWRGEIPLTLLIGRDGSTVTIEGIADLDKVRGWIESQSPG